jgi:aspartyl-tRNA(Asn)/glutamyl-tRNA(Gln) amidotransferase subunit A
MPPAQSFPLHELSILEAGRRLRSGDLTADALARHALSRIAAIDPAINAFIRVDQDRALSDAAAADRAFAAGLDLGPLHGIPYALKDNYDVAGMPTTCGSILAPEPIAARDSVVQAALAAGGGVLLGKLNLHEFATSWPSFDTPFRPARNPWDPDLMPGGSSSGSAAAVASGMARVALGTDTGGSIRWPAGCCGTIGLKPTRGLLSCEGVFPLSVSLDHCGLLGWTVEDVALALQAIGGPVASLGAGPDLRGARIGVCRAFYEAAPGADLEIIDALDGAVQAFADLGAEIVQVRPPPFDLFNACGRIVMAAESFALHERRLRAHPLDYSRNGFRKLALGALVSSADYLRARRMMGELEQALDTGALAMCDALLTANVLSFPPRLEAYAGDDMPTPCLQAIMANVTGHPALAFPIGLSRAGLPMGAQLIGHPFGERTLLRIGAAHERAQGPKPSPSFIKNMERRSAE